MFLRKLLYLLFGLSLLIGLLPTHHGLAQDSEVVTAEVMRDTVNVRYAPAIYYGVDLDTKIGELQRGDVVTVQYYETLRNWSSRRYPWVYVVHPPTGLEGWVNTENLTLSTSDWQAILPSVDSWQELEQLVAVPDESVEGYVYHIFFPAAVRSEPFVYAPFTQTFDSRTPIDVLGRALINGESGDYVYIKERDGDIEGWVAVRLIGTAIQSGDDTWVDALPILYEWDINTETAHLPQACTSSNMRIRSEPSKQSVSLFIQLHGCFAIHGRTNHDVDGWVYVTTLGRGSDGWWWHSGYIGGLQGWVYDPAWERPYLEYQDGFSRDSLPILVP